MPAIHLSPFSPPRKKLRLPQPPEFPFGQFLMPSLLSNPIGPNAQLCCGYSDNIPAGIQGARHAQFGFPSSELHLNKLQAGIFPFGFKQQLEQAAPPPRHPSDRSGNDENLSCLLTIGNSTESLKTSSEMKKPAFVLFGKTILTEEQITKSGSPDTVGLSLTQVNPEKATNLSDGSGSTIHQNGPSDNSSDEIPWYREKKSQFPFEIGQCKVFLESEDIGRTLDLTILRSYEEVYRKLVDMIRIERSEMLSNVVYQDMAGAVKHIGDEPFSEFLKTARKLTIVTDSSSNNVER